MQIFAFEVNVKGKDWQSIVNSTTAGKAKSDYYSHLLDAWPDVKWTQLTCRKIGAAQSSEQFLNTCRHRGVDLKCGQEVFVGQNRGFVVGSDYSANFRVLFDEKSDYPNMELSVHPMEIRVTQ